MQRYHEIHNNDTVALCALSSPAPPEMITYAAESLSAFGLHVAVCNSCFQTDGYLAGSDELRARDFNNAVRDDCIAAIFALRGGYGAQRILPLIDWNACAAARKAFVGYSDATAIHGVLQTRCNLQSIHAPMPATELVYGLDAFTTNAYASCLFAPGADIQNPDGAPLTTLSSGAAEGELVGGNLSVIAAGLGTPYALQTQGKILFLEDTDEEAYRIDRLLTQLAQAGLFHNCAGILLGQFTDCSPTAGISADMVLARTCSGMQKPVLAGLACGHNLPTMTIRLGARLHMDADTCLLRYTE